VAPLSSRCSQRGHHHPGHRRRFTHRPPHPVL